MYTTQVLKFVFSLSVLSFSSALAPARQIYQAPVGTWFENLAVRCNGSILLTSVTAPNLYLVNPFDVNPQAVIVHVFTSALWTTGITETTPDTFYVVAANGTSKVVPPALGSNQLFRVYYPSGPNVQPTVSLAAKIPDAIFINGLATLNPSTVLAADSTKGVVWAINVFNGTSRVVIQDPLMAPTKIGPPIGINGLRVHDGKTLYFTNEAQKLFAKIDINTDGTPLGPPSTIITNATATVPCFDDFELDVQGDAFIATASGNTLAEIASDGEQRVLAGNLNSTEIAQGTSARFGRTFRDRGRLYVTTAGGLAAPVNGDEIVGGQVVAVDLLGK